MADHRAEHRAQRCDHAAFECVVVADDLTPEILRGLSGDILVVSRRARSGRGCCLRPDARTSTARTTAIRSSAGTSPTRWPMWCPPLLKDWTAMIAACTTLDQTVNQIRLRLASGFRAALSRKTPSVAYTPTIIMNKWVW